MTIADIFYLGPLALLASALALKLSPVFKTEWIEYTALVNLGFGVLSVLVLLLFGTVQGALLGPFAILLDIVSVTMLLLVGFTGWIVARFAVKQMRDEPEQRDFMMWMALTLGAVTLLIASGSLAQIILSWFLLSFGLHKLILIYPNRAGAQRTAKKRLLTSILSSLALVAAGLMFYAEAGTLNITQIAQQAEATTVFVWGGGFLALAAVLSVALLPMQGWLIEVVEAPTPVSALLHAGLINAGGFLLIRFADVLTLAPGVLSALVVVGGASALIAGVVMLTQPAVKTALAWSTVAQMGFMILQCGLALWPLALLHIVAHSLYKAHAFLSSGGAVVDVLSIRRPGVVAVPSLGAVLRAFLLALIIYACVAFAFSVGSKSPQAIALGAILVLGVAYLIAQGLADAAPVALSWRVGLVSVVVTFAYFTLQVVAASLTAGTLPAPPIPGTLEWVLIVIAILSFGATALAQATFPLWARHPAIAGLRVHLMNGLYFNALLDRATEGWKAVPEQKTQGDA